MFNSLKSKTLKEDKFDQLVSHNSDNSLTKSQSIEYLDINKEVENKSKKRDYTIKKWENKVSNLVSTVRDKNATIKELESTIHFDKIEYDKRLTELMESSALNVQSLLDEHRLQLQEVEQECEQLKKKLCETQIQLDNFRFQCFSLGEERENIDDLNKQELAKVKHLLILRDSQYEALELKTDELKKSFEKLEIVSKGLKFDVDKKQNDLTRLVKEREIESEERRSQHTTIRGLLTDKENLESKLEECREKLTKTESLLMNVERSSADLHTKLQQSIRDLDLLKSKHLHLEMEKADRESDLKDRIRSLENHLALLRETEEADERIITLEEKCFQLESKCIDEKQLKYDLMKMWSSRVDSLEVQISNLNNKIAEDTQEISQYNLVKAKIREDYERQISDLKQDFVDQEKKILALQIEIDERNSQRNEEQNQWRILEDKLHSNFHQKVIECSNLAQENSSIKKDKAKLQDQNDSLNMILRSKDGTIMQLQDDINKLKMEVEEKSEEISALNGERFKRELKLTELNSLVAYLETTKSDLIKSADQTDSDFKSIQIQIKRLNEEKLLLLRKYETISDQYHNVKRDCDQRIKTMQIEVESRTRELEICHLTIADLQDQIESENSTVLVNVDNSEVLQLKNEIEIFNSQVAEKNNIIRYQKQKISDLKKTLGQELKFNNIATKQPSNDNGHDDIRDQPEHGSECNRNILQSPIDGYSSSGDDDPVVIDKNGFVIMDQINFKYLKHVIVKFLLSRESEAIQLIKALSTLLRLTKDEESRVRMTLEHRGSWFKSSKSIKKFVPEHISKARNKRLHQNNK